MGFIGGIVNISIGAVLMGALFIATLNNTNHYVTCINTTGSYNCATGANVTYTGQWTASEITLWGVLGIAGIVGLVVGTLNVFGIM